MKCYLINTNLSIQVEKGMDAEGPLCPVASRTKIGHDEPYLNSTQTATYGYKDYSSSVLCCNRSSRWLGCSVGYRRLLPTALVLSQEAPAHGTIY